MHASTVVPRPFFLRRGYEASHGSPGLQGRSQDNVTATGVPARIAHAHNLRTCPQAESRVFVVSKCKGVER